MTEVKEKAVLTSGGLYHITGRKMFSNNLTVTSLRVAGEYKDVFFFVVVPFVFCRVVLSCYTL